MNTDTPVRRRLASLLLLVLFGVGGCTTAPNDTTAQVAQPTRSAIPTPTTAAFADPNALPGMPAPLDPNDLYAADRPNALSSAVHNDLNLVYVPNNLSSTVSVIDPITHKVIRTVRVPMSPEHVVPS